MTDERKKERERDDYERILTLRLLEGDSDAKSYSVENMDREPGREK